MFHIFCSPSARSRSQTWRPLVALMLVVALYLGSTSSALATHFRYGNVSWRPLASDPSGRTIQFTINVGYRTTFFLASPSSPTVGQTLTGIEFFNFGDGAGASLDFTITSFSVADDYFYAQSVVTHTYASTAAATQRAFYQSGDRISTLQNNANASYYVGATVTLGNGNQSPASTQSPIVNFAAGLSAATLQIAASDPDGDAITYSLATSADLGGIGFVQPAGLSVSSSGQLTFNTSTASNGQLYNTVIKLTDARGSITFLDFIIRISGTGNPPSFVYGPTPASGSTIAGTVGTPITFTLQATDTDAGDMVTIGGSGIPLGATFSPALPATGSPTASTTFTFTPTANGTFVLVFTATDMSGGQVQTSVTLQIGGITPPPPPPGAFALVAPTYNCQTGQFTYNTINSDGTPITFFAIGINSATTAPGPSYTDDVDAQLAQDISNQQPNVQPLTLYATQSGVTVTYVWDALAACGGITPPPPPPTPTGCNSPTATFGQTLTLQPPSYTCSTGEIQFNTTGGDGSPITYFAIGIVSATTDCRDQLDTQVAEDVFNDQPNVEPFVLFATQNGVTATYTFDARAFCRMGHMRRGAEPDEAFGVSVLSNPVAGEAVEFEVRGVAGQPLRATIVDGQGRTVSSQSIEQATTKERRSLRLGRQAGMYLLQISTPTRAQTVKVIKQ